MVNLLCDLQDVDSALTQECNADTDVVYNLLEDEEPDGIP
jgi:hypothetical protein